MVDLTFIKDEFDKIINGEIEGLTPIDRTELIDNGSVFYMNGNDGTYFDHHTNRHSCEFSVYLKNEYSYAKAFHDDYKVVFYIYDRDNPTNGECKQIEIESKYSLRKACNALEKEFDDKCRFNKKIENWAF